MTDITTVEAMIDKYLVLDQSARQAATSIATNAVELVEWITTAKDAVAMLELVGVRVGALAGPWGVLAVTTAFATKKVLDYIDASNRVPGYGGGGEMRVDRYRDGKGGWYLEYSVKSSEALSGWRKATPDEIPAYQENQRQPWSLKGDSTYLETMNSPGKRYELQTQLEAENLRKESISLGHQAVFMTAGKDPEQERQELQNKLDTMLRGLREKVSQETSTTLSYQLSQLANEAEKMQRELENNAAKFANHGLDTTAVEEMMKQYGDVMTRKYTEEQTRALKTLQADTSMIEADLVGDKQAAAEAKYQAALVAIEKEREAKLKASGDEAAVNNWAVAKKKAAEKEKTDTVREALQRQYELAKEHNNLLVVLEGKTQAEVDKLNSQILKDQLADINNKLSNPKLLPEERMKLESSKSTVMLQQEELDGRDIGKAVPVALKQLGREYTNWAVEAKNSFHAVDASFENHLAKMLSGQETFSKGMVGIFQDMVNEISRMMAKMWYEQVLMKPVQNWWGKVLSTVLDSGKPSNITSATGSSDSLSSLSSWMTSYSSKVNFFKEKAAGGPVTAGNMYKVNELGIETFVPSVNGYIMNASQTRQALNVSSNNPIQTLPNVEININNQSGQDVQVSKKVNYDKQTQRMMVEMFIDAKRRNVGGLRDALAF